VSEQQESTRFALSRRIRSEILAWFGIVGAVLTLAGHLEELLTVAKWIRSLIDSWLHVLVFVWRHILFFLPSVPPSDAVFFTFIVFGITNIVSCLIPEKERIESKQAISIVAAAIIILLVFFVGYFRALFEQLYSVWAGRGYACGLDCYIRNHMPDVFKSSNLFSVVATFLIEFVFIALIPAVGSALVIKYYMSLHLSAKALSVRLWRIAFGIILLLSVNQLSLWVEHQNWFPPSVH
jgi:hypothetical protein